MLMGVVRHAQIIKLQFKMEEHANLKLVETMKGLEKMEHVYLVVTITE